MRMNLFGSYTDIPIPNDRQMIDDEENIFRNLCDRNSNK